MRKPLAPLQAFAEDARLATERGADVHEELVQWLSVAQAAEQLAATPAPSRYSGVADARRVLAAFVGKRPTIVHDVQPAPDEPLEQLCEEFRVAAEAMERGGCFELAFAVVSAVCRLNATGGYASAMLATTHLGRVARQMNELSFSHDCYAKVVDTCTRERDGPLQARGHVGLALVADMRGNMPACEAEYRRVLDVATPNGSCAVAAWQGLMTLHMLRGDLAEAMLYGWNIYDATEHDLAHRVGALTDLAIIAMQSGFLLPAMNGFRQALALSSVERERMPILGGAVRAAAALGDRALTSEFDVSVLQCISRANQPYMASMTLLNTAEAWFTLRDFPIASARIRQARELAERFRYAEYIFRADELDARVESEQRQPAPKHRHATATPYPDGDEITANGLRRLETLRA